MNETAIQGDLLSTRRMLGGGVPGVSSPKGRRGTTARFQNPMAVTQALEHAAGQGVKRVVSVGDARLFKAMRLAGAGGPGLLPIVPNIQGFMREAVEHGMVGAGIQRVRRMGLGALAGLTLRGVGRGPLILKRDFPTLLRCFIEMELADVRRFDSPVIFLQAQMTDLAVAMDNPRVLQAFVQAVGRLTGAQAGFMTGNFGWLVQRLEEWGIEPGPVITPWEASGAAMRPSREACETALRRTGMAVWADRAGQLHAPTEEERQYFKESGVRGILRDDDEALGISELPHRAGRNFTPGWTEEAVL